MSARNPPAGGGKTGLLFLLYTVLLGAVVGAIIWAFLRVMNLGIGLLWERLPEKVPFPFYTIVVCVIGGFLIGLWKKKFGDYPEELPVVMKTVKKTGRYPYRNLFPTLGSALFPLVLGASVGPEAGLTGIIAGLCTWVGDKLKGFRREVDELTRIGISATLGTVFNSPMFGFMEPIEADRSTVLAKRAKLILYITAILSSFGTFYLLSRLFGGGSGLEAIPPGEGVSGVRILWTVPLILAGILAGWLFFVFEALCRTLAKPLEKAVVLRCALGGLLLGLLGTVLPLTMFSGEHQIAVVLEEGAALGAGGLLVTGVVKLLLTNLCIASGLKGGHFFPVIFSGVCLGYGLSLLLKLDPVFSMAVVTAALVAHILKKPLAAVLLLMIVFPPRLIPVMLLAAAAASWTPGRKGGGAAQADETGPDK